MRLDPKVQLTCLFVLFQVAIVAYSDSSYLMIKCAMHKHMVIPLVVWKACSFYLFVQFCLYSVFVLLVSGITHFSAITLKLSPNKKSQLGILLCLLGFITILLANQVFYQASFFSSLLNVLFSISIAKVLLLICASIFMMFTLISFYGAFKKSYCCCSVSKKTMVIAFLVLNVGALFSLFFLMGSKQQIVYASKQNQPNVFIIGIDALRPDFIGYYGNKENLTPNIDDFLSKSINFRHSITPMSRTFPAWTSILTGQYPVHNHVRFNLIEQYKLNLQDTLPAILQRHHYKTFYATDDRRFSDISKRFGFDKLIGVNAGVNDFILGTLNDFPLSNLIVNTKLGRYLFPYSYANRAAFATYKPNTFVKLVINEIQQTGDQPIFLAIHFCLPHWPFFWADMANKPGLTNRILYQETIREVDKQFGLFLNKLKTQGFLDNAILVVLSDHGEAFAEPGDRLIKKQYYVKGMHSHRNIFKIIAPSLTDKKQIDLAFSHGTDVLSDVQNHNLLAFRRFGFNNHVSNTTEKLYHNNYFPVSLVDIKPTILNGLHLSSKDTDGVSLISALKKKDWHVKDRMIFAETGFTPLSVKSTKISIKNTVIEGADMFQVNSKTGRISLKPTIIPQLLKTKQRAVFYKNWVLALYPDKNNKKVYILVNQNTHEWTDDLSTAFAKNAPVKKMLAALLRTNI